MNSKQKTVFAAFILGIAMNVFAASGEVAKKHPVEGTQGFRDEINRPPEPYTGPPRNGKQVYAYRCAACHAKTTQGAPMPGDDIEWGLRARKGMKVLMEHAIDGYKQGLMPVRGGCRNCSDAEVRGAVVFMLRESGIEVPK